MGNTFHHDSSFISFLSMLGNMMLLSCFWCMTCIGIITIVPSCAAFYHATVKVVRGNGTGLAKAYFSSFKQNFKQGWVLSAIFLVGAFVLYTCLDFGAQMSSNGAGFAYLIIMVIVTVFVVSMVVYIPPVLSRFDVKNSGVFRLSLYFSMMNPAKTFLVVLMLALSIFMVWFSSGILMMFIPGVFVTAMSYIVEKSFRKYMLETGLITEEAPADETLQQPVHESAIAQAKSLDLDNKDN